MRQLASALLAMSSSLALNPTCKAPATKLLLTGDVMIGRGIDQILQFPSNPIIYEGYMKSALGYVAIAEKISGAIPRNVPVEYIWGDVPQMMREATPGVDAVIINLETSVTTSDDYWRGKSINYRMEPRNAAPVLKALGTNCAVLANNHILDWGYQGMDETLRTLQAEGIQTAGAGANIIAAAKPAIIELSDDRRVLVFSLGSMSAGVPAEWGAAEDRPGVLMLDGPSQVTLANLETIVQAYKRDGDIAIASIHWGSNWGYDVPPERQRIAHALIDKVGFDMIHGHSSHHPIGVEVYRGKLIMYGCDYEGIEHHYAFRGDLAFAFVPTIGRSGELISLEFWPLKIQRFQLVRAQPKDVTWLAAVMDRECGKFGGHLNMQDDGILQLSWS